MFVETSDFEELKRLLMEPCNIKSFAIVGIADDDGNTAIFRVPLTFEIDTRKSKVSSREVAMTDDLGLALRLTGEYVDVYMVDGTKFSFSRLKPGKNFIKTSVTFGPEFKKQIKNKDTEELQEKMRSHPTKRNFVIKKVCVQDEVSTQIESLTTSLMAMQLMGEKTGEKALGTEVAEYLGGMRGKKQSSRTQASLQI